MTREIGNKLQTAERTIDALSTGIYESYVHTATDVSFTDGELGYTSGNMSGEVTFGDICRPSNNRSSESWARAIYEAGQLRSFTYQGPADEEGYFTLLKILPSADGYQVYREPIRTDGEKALLGREFVNFTASPRIAGLLATFVIYACKEDLVHTTTEVLNVNETIRIRPDPVSALSQFKDPSRRPPAISDAQPDGTTWRWQTQATKFLRSRLRKVKDYFGDQSM